MGDKVWGRSKECVHSVQKALEPQAPLSAHLQPPQAEPCKETVSSYQGSDEKPRHNPDQKISERSPRVLRLKSSAMAVENIRRPVRGGGGGGAGAAGQKRAGK